MRRLAHHIATVCAAVSLGASLVVLGLWLCTGSSFAGLHWGGLRRTQYYRVYFWSGGGDLTVECVRDPWKFASDSELDGFHWAAPQPISNTHFWSGHFDAHHSVGGATRIPSEIRALSVPHWFALLVCLLLPLAVCGWRAARRQRLHRLRVAGRCTRCGYDLRESRDRCPECGALAK
jgi:hypothetical protein